MNKKGLILIFLFVVSTVGVVASSQAASNNKVDVYLNYIPSAYVDMGYVWVEFDQRLIDDNDVFSQNDVISFSFYYDVAFETWGGAVAPGGGIQTEEWYYCPENNWTAGYTGVWLYNETRFAGWIDVILDGYDMGTSNFDVGVDGGTMQKIPIQLDVGYHYLTITAAELVSDGNHTEWMWEYSKDQKRFYVGETRLDVPPLLDDANYNILDVTATAVLSENLPNQGYTITEFLDNPRPLAEANNTLQKQVVDLGVEGTNVTTDIQAFWNASDTTLGLAPGLIYSSLYEMGPNTNFWILNNGEMQFGVTEITGLHKGLNWLYFTLYGFAVDDIALYSGYPAPRIQADVAIFSIWVGPLPETAGLNFGIFISVSILGLAAALYFVRRRK